MTLKRGANPVIILTQRRGPLLKDRDLPCSTYLSHAVFPSLHPTQHPLHLNEEPQRRFYYNVIP